MTLRMNDKTQTSTQNNCMEHNCDPCEYIVYSADLFAVNINMIRMSVAQLPSHMCLPTEMSLMWHHQCLIRGITLCDHQCLISDITLCGINSALSVTSLSVISPVLYQWHHSLWHHQCLISDITPCGITSALSVTSLSVTSSVPYQ